ncbi:hypothetical protein [Burkholderia sp. Ac-20365]|jgi:hypothetical protein|uniref:hypothetical protein n=1 Tax=Burkholderia sp. Ac-20365 TaxID=2703897 RepID=UPI00197C5BE8|nr:hypothetical protein [Burkholderia sp. Ac-20365]MBN3765267.1 hypothetical protein [Burkholderia sp. Ac-20365]
MSYDLYFNFSDPIPGVEIERFFGGRANYQVNDGATYQNASTGVYFTFLWSRDGNGNKVSRVSFNINYFRPHVFALEAEPELSAFVARFSPNIEDPQLHGMGSGPYARERFLAGWNTGNEAAYDAILRMQQPSQKVYTLPSAELESIWRWNLLIGETQAKFGQSLFVPRIMMLAVNGELITIAVWGDGIPELIPEVQAVLVVRDALSPLKGSNTKDRCLVSQDKLDSILAPLANSGYPRRVRIPQYNEPPQAVRSFIQSLMPTSDHITGIPLESVLDRELASKYAHVQ